MTAIVTAQGIDKAFGSRRVLTGVSFAIAETDRVGLVGVNGSGKSTLLRLLADPEDEPDAGLITRKRGLRIDYVPQEPVIAAERTIADVLREGLGRRADAADVEPSTREHEVREIAHALGLPKLETATGVLSIGERRRVALARALLAQPELLALDEPTNHLDAEAVEWLEGRLSELPGALLLVTHDRYFLDRVATRIIELDRGEVHAYEGGYSRFLEKQSERLATETARERIRASFVRRELDWIRRGPQARATKQKARIDRFDAAVAEKPGRADALPGEHRLVLPIPTGGRLGKTILELKGVSKSIAGKLLFRELSLILKPGDRIGIVGPNGAGKTTLVKCILGDAPLDAGEVVHGINTRIAFLDQGRADLRDDRTVLQEVAGDSEMVELDDGPMHVRSFLRMLLFDDGFADTPVGALSGGERNRVQLAKLLRKGGNLLILDEPTNDLDLMTLGVLEEALCGFPGCALVVSHDRWFLDRIATGILAFEGDGRVVLYEGSWTDWHKRRPAPQAAAAPKKEVVAREKMVGPRRASFKEKQELAGIEAAITAAEAAIKSLEAELEDPALYRERAAEVKAKVAALEAARHEVERLYARWQELEQLPQ